MTKDAYWFPHDSNAHTDPKMVKLLRLSGWAGHGVYWMMVGLLRSENEAGYKLPLDYIDDLCFSMRIEREIIDAVFESKLLQDDGEMFWSESLIRRMSEWDEKRKRRVDAGRKGGQAKAKAKRKQRSSNAKAKVQQCPSKKRTEQKRTEQDSTEKETPPEASRLAGSLYRFLMDIKPDRKDVKKTSVPKWAIDIEKLHRIDKRDWPRIEAVIDWLFVDYTPSNSFDWRDNIKSGAKLKKQFDQLELLKNKRPAIITQSDKNEAVLERMRRGEI